MRRSLVSYQGLTAGLSTVTLVIALAGCAASRPSATAIIAGEPAPAPSIRMGDSATIARILDEGKNRNQVMAHLQHLSEKIGPRLTGSAACEQANQWTADQFRSWGITDVGLHEWGTIAVRFDRGPSTGKIIQITRPRSRRAASDAPADGTKAEEPKPEETVIRQMEFSTLAWGAGTQGPLRGPVVRMPETEEEFQAVKDQLKGSWVLLKAPPNTGRRGIRAVGGTMNERSQARYSLQTGKTLEQLGIAENDRPDVQTLVDKFARLKDSGVLGYISSSRDERVWTTSFRGWRELDPAALPRDVEVSVRLSDYDCINSRLTDGDEVVVEFDLAHRFTPGPIPVYNTVATIRGTEKPDEFVIVSAHLDSWDGPGSQGTTDNGTGSAVTLEAARLLMAAGARPKRSIKFILWTGEEQGLLGSRQWVTQNKDLWPKISACFVDDGGTNYQGGLKCTDEMIPVLAAATAPINNHFFDSKDGKPLNVNIQGQGEKFPSSGGSDHASFVRENIPGFFWDEVGRAEYGYGWHTQNDRMNLAVPEYLMQSATCSAITAYNLACAPDLLPRLTDESKATDRDRARERERGRPPQESEGNSPTAAPAPGSIGR